MSEPVFKLPPTDTEGRAWTIREHMIMQFLPWGRQNAITEERFAARLPLTTTKDELRDSMMRMRLAHIPICSASADPPGVYFPADKTEGEEGFQSLRRRYSTQIRVAAAMRQGVRSMRQPEDGERSLTDTTFGF